MPRDLAAGQGENFRQCDEGGIESWDLGEHALRPADHMSGCHVVLGLMPGAHEAAVSVDTPIGKIRP